MFEFAISQNERRRPTRRIFASWVASCLAHFLAVLLLIQFPQLLQGGIFLRFRPIPMIANLLNAKSDTDGQSWRTVTIVRKSSPMQAPSAATLKKYLYDWDKKGQGSGGVPPVRVRWGKEQEAALQESLKPIPRVQPPQQAQEPKLPFPAPEVAPSAATQGGQSTAAQSPSEPSRSGPSVEAAQSESPPGTKGSLNLPAPKKGAEAASNTAPTSIPNTVKPSSSASSEPKTTNSNLFDSGQKAIRGEGIGIFDTNGFPLGDYVDLIKERIKGNWLIPSNLRDSQGHTTVVFYIDKSGQFTNLKMVLSSGSNSLDIAALNAVIESSPFPPLPKGFPGDHIGARFIFSYNEHQ